MMAEYIEREAFLAEQRHLYCENCARRKGMKNGKMKFVYEIGDAPCRACGIGDVLDDIEYYAAADVAPVVRCRDCVYWQKPQIMLGDGTYRDYLPGEYESGPFGLGVTADVGINIGAYCAKYDTDHQNRIPQFMGPDDYCSKGYRAKTEVGE